jgi:hypothetical protein
MTSSEFASPYDHPRWDWLSEEMCRIADVVWSDPHAANDYLATLSTGNQCVFYLLSFINRVYNGGVDSYLTGSYHDDFDHCIHYFEQVGSSDVVSAMRELRSHLPNGFHNIVDQKELYESVSQVCAQHKVKRLDEIVEIDVDQVDLEKVYRYVIANREQGVDLNT